MRGAYLSRIWLLVSVPDTDIEDGVQADISGTGKVLLVLAHLDGVQPIIHSAHTELWGGWVLPAEMESTFQSNGSCSCSEFMPKKYASQGRGNKLNKNPHLNFSEKSYNHNK